MTDQQFQDLVKKLEKKAAEDISGYRRKTLMLAAAGYFYISTLLLVILLLLCGLAYLMIQGKGQAAIIKLVFIIGATGLAVIRSLWVRWPEPDGIRLRQQDAPLLFSEVEGIRHKLKAPRIHRILLNDSFNAAMEQKPRLGIFGWPRGYLHIGLPLLDALDPQQFRSVLAHELGHLSGNHARLSAWVYNARLRWWQVMQQFEKQDHFGSGLFKSFFKWYAPYLSAYSFVMARKHEYEADKRAAEITSAETMVGALVAIDVQALHLEQKFWPKIYKEIKASAEAPRDVFTQMQNGFRGSLNPNFIAESLSTSLKAETGYTDTHPCLRDRVAAFGFGEEWIQNHALAGRQDGISAAEYYFGQSHDVLTKRLDNNWNTGIQDWWQQKHKEALDKSENFSNIEAEIAAGNHDVELMWTRAELAYELLESKEALVRYRDLLDAHPDHAAGHYRIGESMLAAGEEQGIASLNRAMELDPSLIVPACALISQYLLKGSRLADAEIYEKRAKEQWDLQQNAERERENFESPIKLRPHNLDKTELE
jgi:Zn-dependent protease with chaperone function